MAIKEAVWDNIGTAMVNILERIHGKKLAFWNKKDEDKDQWTRNKGRWRDFVYDLFGCQTADKEINKELLRTRDGNAIKNYCKTIQQRQ